MLIWSNLMSYNECLSAACPNLDNCTITSNGRVASCSGSSSPIESQLSQSAPSTIFTFSHDENNFSQLGVIF